MIFQDVITNINVLLDATHLFNKNYGICELLKNGEGQQYPAHYKGAGEYEHVFEPDKYWGISYIRKNGTVKIEEKGETSYKACATILQHTIPLKIVCIIPKKKLSCDDEFADDNIAQTITSLLGGAKDFVGSAFSSYLNITDYNTDNISILSDEFSNIDIVDIHYKYSYLVVNVEAVVTIDKSCLDTECETDSGVFVISKPKTICDVIEDCSVIQDIQNALAAILQVYWCQGIGPDYAGPAALNYPAVIGAIDGVNTLFMIPSGSYSPNRIFPYLDGQLIADFTQTDPATGKITFATAPNTDSIITIMSQK